jgi:hypothetical protein
MMYLLAFSILPYLMLQVCNRNTFISSLIAPTVCHVNSNRLEEVSTDYMDAERDIKPFVSPVLATTIQRKLHGPSACQPTALPLERGGTRVLPQTQPQAACVLKQAASELSGGISDRSISADEALEGTSARRPCSAPPPWLSRKFWGAGDYDAATGRSAPQPPSMS